MSRDSENFLALGRGLYGVTELAHYVAYQSHAKVRADDVARWLRSALNPVEHARRRPDYSFHDLVSLFVVRELVGAGVRPAAIRLAEIHLRGTLGIERPFAHVRVKTDGVNVLYEASPMIEDQLTAANRLGQEVSVPTIATALRSVVFEHDVAVRWMPDESIELDPAVQFGEPHIRGTRVLTEQIAELAKKASLEEVARWYELTLDAVESAVRFERRLAAAA